MSNVYDLAKFRRKTKQSFLSRHGARLDRFIDRFIRTHIDIDFERITEGYQAGCQDDAWDYVHFREILCEAFDQAFGDHLYQLLGREVWFEQRLMSKDEIVERCLSAFILGHCNVMMLGR